MYQSADRRSYNTHARQPSAPTNSVCSGSTGQVIPSRGSPVCHGRDVYVGHNRNSFLHHAESLIARSRLEQRRFPVLVDGERIWWETLDVGDDDDTHFPVVGRDYERHTEIRPAHIGHARTVLLPARDFVSFGSRRLTELLDKERTDARPLR